MHPRQKYLTVVVLVIAAFFQTGCRSEQTNENKADLSPGDGKDPQTLISETVNHFKANTLTSTAKITKVYKSNLTFNDELRFQMKVNGRDMRAVIMVKPQTQHKGMGLLVNYQNERITSVYRYIPETQRVVEMSPDQSTSNVVLGGLSLQDFQIFQGISPFEEITIGAKEEINGQLCYRLDATLANKSEYTNAQFFTSVAERLPVLMRVFNKEGVMVKVISINKLEPRGNTWVVRQLAVSDEVFGYVSTFDFDNIQVDVPLADTIFTAENLKKGW